MAPSILGSTYISQKNWIAIVQDDGVFTVRNVSDAKVIYTFADKKFDITCCNVVDEHPVIILGTSSGNILFINYLTWKIQGTLQGKHGLISHCKKSPKGDYIAIVIDSYHFVLWDFPNQKSKINKKFTNVISSIQFSSSGDGLYLGFQDSLIHKYSLYPVTLVDKYSIYEDYNSFSVSQDNNIAVCFNDRIEIYSLIKKRENSSSSYINKESVFQQCKSRQSSVIPIKHSRVLTLNAGGILSCCFGKNSETLYFCNIYGQIITIDIKSDSKKRTVLFSSDHQSTFHNIYYHDGFIVALYKDGSIIEVSDNPNEQISITLYPTDVRSEPRYDLGKVIINPLLSSPSSVHSPPVCQIQNDELSPEIHYYTPDISKTDRITPNIVTSFVNFDANYPNEQIRSDIKSVLPTIDINLNAFNIVNGRSISPIHSQILENLEISPNSAIFSDIGVQPEENYEILSPQISISPQYSNYSIQSYQDGFYELLDPLIIPVSQSSIEINEVIYDKKSKLSPTLIIPDASFSQEINDITRQNSILPISDELIPNRSILLNTIINDLDPTSNNSVHVGLSVQSQYSAVTLPQGSDSILFSMLPYQDNVSIATIFPAFSLTTNTSEIPFVGLLPHPKPKPSLQFNENIGVYIHFAEESGFSHNEFSIDVKYSDDTDLKKKNIFPNNDGISDEIIVYLDEPDVLYKVNYCKEEKEYAHETIKCFDNDIEGYVFFSENGKNLSIHERLPPEEIVIVVHRSNQIKIAETTFITGVTPNWPDYDFYIIPFTHNISITINDEPLRYALINEPILTEGNEYLDLPIQTNERFFRNWPSLLIPLRNNRVPIVDLNVKIILYRNNRESPIEFRAQINGDASHSIDLNMGYLKIDFNKFGMLTEYSAGKVIFSIPYQPFRREFKFNLVPDLSIAFQPENSPFLHINDSELDVRGHISGPSQISPGLKKSDRFFEFSKNISVTDLVKDPYIPLTLKYRISNDYEAQFKVNLEIPIIAFILKSEKPLPTDISSNYVGIEDKSVKIVNIPVEYAYYHNFHNNIEITFPSYRKGNCSLIISQASNDLNGKSIILDEVHKKRNKTSSISFSLREVRDAIHNQLIFPLNVQLKYRERFGETYRDQTLDLYRIEDYEVNSLNYIVKENNSKYSLNLCWKEINRLHGVTTVVLGKHFQSIQGLRNGLEYEYQQTIEFEKSNSSNTIQFIISNKLIRSFPISLSTDYDSVRQSLWELGYWKQFDDYYQKNNVKIDSLFLAKHYHLLKYVWDDTKFSSLDNNMKKLIKSLLNNPDQNLFTYGLYLKLISNQNMDSDYLDLQMKIATIKNNTLLYQMLALIYANNHEYIKSKAVLKNYYKNIEDFYSNLYLSNSFEILGVNLFAENHFFEKAFTLLKIACTKNYSFIPFWIRLKHICELYTGCPDEIFLLAQYMIEKLSLGHSVISNEERRKIGRILQ